MLGAEQCLSQRRAIRVCACIGLEATIMLTPQFCRLPEGRCCMLSMPSAMSTQVPRPSYASSKPPSASAVAPTPCAI
eukprot:6181817-Pleurochrysis_carterae.AAC.5